MFICLQFCIYNLLKAILLFTDFFFLHLLWRRFISIWSSGSTNRYLRWTICIEKAMNIWRLACLFFPLFFHLPQLILSSKPFVGIVCWHIKTVKNYCLFATVVWGGGFVPSPPLHFLLCHTSRFHMITFPKETRQGVPWTLYCPGEWRCVLF